MGLFESKPQEPGAPEVVLPINPTSVEDFGYEWKQEPNTEPHEYQLQIRDKATGEPFKYLNKRHYDALGEMVTQFVTQLMTKDFGLAAVELCPNVFVYHTPDVKKNTDRLMVIIQGSGPVRPGQWARSLCINNTLAQGTILPYLHRARFRGFGIIIANPNTNLMSDPDDPDAWIAIEGSSTPEEHVVTLWDKLISKCPAKEIVVVAHSYGGIATVNLLHEKEAEFVSRVKAVALTDSVHSRIWPNFKTELSKEARKYFTDNAVNWIKSKTPLGTEIGEHFGCEAISAGHEVHEWTSYTAMEAVFEYIDKKVTPLSKKALAQRRKSSKNLSAPGSPRKDGSPRKGSATVIAAAAVSYDAEGGKVSEDQLVGSPGRSLLTQSTSPSTRPKMTSIITFEVGASLPPPSPESSPSRAASPSTTPTQPTKQRRKTVTTTSREKLELDQNTTQAGPKTSPRKEKPKPSRALSSEHIQLPSEVKESVAVKAKRRKSSAKLGTPRTVDSVFTAPTTKE